MSRSTRAPVRTGCGGGAVGLGGLLALGPGDGLDGAERPVEPGLLGSLDLVEGQAQVVLQVLVREEQVKEVSLSAVSTQLVYVVLLVRQQKPNIPRKIGFLNNKLSIFSPVWSSIYC